MNIRIDMACNDPDNGVFAHRVCQISIACDLIELAAKNWNITSFSGCPTLREKSGAVVLSGKSWPIIRSTEWHGNWCWNAYWMDDQVAADFTLWLHKRDTFQVEIGEERLFNLWRLRKPLDREFVHCQLVKSMLAQQGSA